MGWQELGALGEIVGGVAAVVLLAYIAYQIRQNSHLLEQNARATRAATYQASAQFWAHGWSLLAQDPSLAQVWRRALAGDDLDEDEIIRFEAFLNVMCAYADDAFAQATLGTYDVDPIELGSSFISEVLACPLALNWWRRNGHRFYGPEFNAAVEHLLPTSREPAA